MKTGKEVSEAAKKAAAEIGLENESMHSAFGSGYASEETIADIIQLAIDAQLANARNDALEEAAKECNDIADKMITDLGEGQRVQYEEGFYPETEMCVNEVRKTAIRLRALKKGPNHV